MNDKKSTDQPPLPSNHGNSEFRDDYLGIEFAVPLLWSESQNPRPESHSRRLVTRPDNSIQPPPSTPPKRPK